MRKNLTEIVFILDRSGSMSGLEADTIGGFNSMIEKQKKENGEALISTVLFELDSRVVLRVAPLADDELVNLRSAARKGADDYRDSHNESRQSESLFHW